MKKLIVCFSLLLALISCQDAVQQVAGTYSYKISGSVIITSTNLLGEEENDTVTLSEEMGTMELIPLDSITAMMTFNALNGPVYVTQAEIHDKDLTLQSYERDIMIRAKDYHITASGDGEFYDNTLIITLQYECDGVEDNQLIMLCKKN